MSKSHIVLGIALAVVAADDIQRKIKTRKMVQEFNDAHKALAEAYALNLVQIMYLCHMLDEHGIEPSEFDLIALNFNQ